MNMTRNEFIANTVVALLVSPPKPSGDGVRSYTLISKAAEDTMKIVDFLEREKLAPWLTPETPANADATGEPMVPEAIAVEAIERTINAILGIANFSIYTSGTKLTDKLEADIHGKPVGWEITAPQILAAVKAKREVTP